MRPDANRSLRNFLVLAWYQVVIRVGWIFKTESIIVPAFVDMIAGPGWVRGCLPALNRLGQSIPPVILVACHTLTIPESVELLGINRKDMEAAFEQPFDNRATRHFNGHGDPLRLSRRHAPQPGR